MIGARGSFFITGGTLGQDAPCYVERRADKELHAALLAGEFCYVLDSRQMGKSSLMVRTAARLTADGVHVVVLDLTQIGRNLSVEQWYYGLLGHTGEQLGLRKELREYWLQQPLLSPLQRWMSALREVILPRCRGPLVIFIDEVDAVRGLPFSTDEFFAGIRECFNRRTQDPVFQRLAFCFLGVATPSDLMQDARITPFNVGRRIELSDFSEDEAKPLAYGLALGDLGTLERPMQQARALLGRVLQWTGGHPYLTQKLCLGVVTTPGVNSPEAVDEVCVQLFLSDAAREKDDNLIFVRDRMLRSEVDVPSLLDVYNRVLLGKRVRDNPSEPLYRVLHLSGIVREERGVLHPRNQIYTTVFDREWAVSHAPRAKLSDPRSEARRALIRRTALVSLLVLGVVGVPSLVGLTAQRIEDRARQRREGAYLAAIRQAEASYEVGKLDRMADQLARLEPASGQEDLRGFEWGYYWRLSHQAVQSIPAAAPVASVRFSPDGRQLYAVDREGLASWSLPDASPQARAGSNRHFSGFGPGNALSAALSRDGSRAAMVAGANEIALLDRSPSHETRLRTIGPAVRSLALSSDGKALLVGLGGSVELRATEKRVLRPLLPGHPGGVTACAFSENGAVAATGGEDATVRCWDPATGRPLAARKWDGYPVTALALSRDGKLVAASVLLTEPHEDRLCRVDIWDRRTQTLIRTYPAVVGLVRCLAFSPRGDVVAAGNWVGELAFLPLARGERPTRFLGHTGAVSSVAWSPDGKRVASSGIDGQVRLWEPAAVPATVVIAAHSQPIAALGFSPDSRLLNTAAADGSARAWDVATLRARREAVTAPPAHDPLRVATPDGKEVAIAADTTIRLRERSGAREALLEGHGAPIRCLALSPDGRTLASGDVTPVIRLWNRATGKQVAELRSSLQGVTRLAFSPTGDTLAAAGETGRVQIWRATLPAQIPAPK